ncbi:MAG: hypothetical protein JRH11_06970 [Deltaproteobacteria bacterium]|nr:hypothetical protein [Deltaproteobacteria bacterium]
MLLRIRGWNGLPDDARVEVDIMEAVCGINAAQPETECATFPAPAWDGGDRFMVSPRSVRAADATRALTVNDNAYVANGQLVATLPNTINLSFPLRDKLVYVGFTDASFVVPLPGPGEIAVPLAVMTGRWPIGPATETLRFLGNCPDVAGSSTLPIAEIIDRALDIRADPADDHQGLECNAISISFTMTGYRGLYGGVGDEVVVPRAACPS